VATLNALVGAGPDVVRPTYSLDAVLYCRTWKSDGVFPYCGICTELHCRMYCRTAGNLHKHQNSRYFTQAPEQPVLYTSTRTVGTLHKHHSSRYFTQAPEQPVLYTSTRTARTSHKHHHTVLITSRSVLLRIKNIAHKSRTANQSTFCVQ